MEPVSEEGFRGVDLALFAVKNPLAQQWAPVGAGRGRRGDRLQQCLPLRPVRSARRSGSEWRPARGASDARGEPELLRSTDRRRARGARAAGAPAAPGRGDLPVRFRRGDRGARRARARRAPGTGRRHSAAAHRRRSGVRVQLHSADRPVRGERLHARGDEGRLGDAQDPSPARPARHGHRGARTRAGRARRGGTRVLRPPGRARIRPRKVAGVSRDRGRGRSRHDARADAARRRGARPGDGGPRARRPARSQRARVLRGLGQPAQGGGAQRRADRGALVGWRTRRRGERDARLPAHRGVRRNGVSRLAEAAGLAHGAGRTRTGRGGGARSGRRDGERARAGRTPGVHARGQVASLVAETGAAGARGRAR